MSKMKQIAALTAMLVGVIMYAAPAKSAVCFLPDDDGSCGGGDIEISDGSDSDDNKPEEKCDGFTISAAEYEKMKDCFSFLSCTKSKNKEVKYKKGAQKENTTWSNGICCAGGTTYDSAEGKCCPAGGCTHECDAPKEWSSTLHSCECPKDREENTNHECCPVGEHADGAICCPEKKHNDGGKCVCDSKYNTDKDGNCVLPIIDNNLYLQVDDGYCHQINALEGAGVEYIGTKYGSKLYKIAYGSQVNIKYTKNETIYDNNGNVLEECEFYNWEFDNISSTFVNNSFNYDENLYKKIKIYNNDLDSKEQPLGSKEHPEVLFPRDNDCTGACKTYFQIASISASRAIPYMLGLKKIGGDDTYTKEMNNKYDFYVLYEPGKNVNQYNATAYKCNVNRDDLAYKSYFYNYIGWINGKPYMVGKSSDSRNSEVFKEMSFVIEGKERSSYSDIIIRDDFFSIYDIQGDNMSNNLDQLVYCEPFKLEDDKYVLSVLSNVTDDSIYVADAGVVSLVYFETTGKALPDSYLEVTRKMVSGNTDKTAFSYKFVGNDFPNNNSSECKISCGDKNWNESINNGNGVIISCKNGGCANGKTGTITADYIVGKSLEPKSLLPTGCTCHCTRGYTCIIK